MKHPVLRTQIIKDFAGQRLCSAQTFPAYQIDDIDLSQGETIPALRMSLPVHGQPFELGERIKTCPQENVVLKIILQTYVSNLRGKNNDKLMLTELPQK